MRAAGGIGISREVATGSELRLARTVNAHTVLEAGAPAPAPAGHHVA
jgi:hypothetical protein